MLSKTTDLPDLVVVCAQNNTKEKVPVFPKTTEQGVVSENGTASPEYFLL